MVRSGSVGYMDDGYVPDYHTGRKMSASQQYEVIFQGHTSIFCQTGKIDSFSNEQMIKPKNFRKTSKFRNHHPSIDYQLVPRLRIFSYLGLAL